MATSLDELFRGNNSIVVQQLKEWLEVLSNFETVNKYEILDERGSRIAYAAEDGGGFGRTILRLWLKSHRPLTIHILDAQGRQLLGLTRPFYFFFSNMAIEGEGGRVLGRAKKRFGIIYKKYDLLTEDGTLFARIRAPFWRLWSFPVYDPNGNEIGMISKRWGGFIKEAFTDADRFVVQLPQHLSPQQKAVLLASALSVDLDYFEENVGRSSS